MSQPPERIALLLPLSGPLASSAQALQEGFLAASSVQHQMNGKAPQIILIDTQNDQNIQGAYREARNQGADLIVGPLTKQGVEALTRLAERHIPVLALNYIDENTPGNFIEFGLAPEDEARAAADKAWQEGKKSVVILAQEGDWGRRLDAAFRERFESLGGRVQDSAFYPSNRPLSGPIKALLQINASEARASQLIEDINMPLEYETRRRQDIDAVFMAAQLQEARQIPPLFAFYFANDLPIYATSSVYAGVANPVADKDLNGVTFCDIPWNTENRPSEYEPGNLVASLWPSPAQVHPRLYALGIDAYQTLTFIPSLESMPYFSVNGATGKLSLNENRGITRGLRCTKFVAGEVKRLDFNG